ncbi:MAG: hypothetical protein HY747_10820 [Elusimicrobia bacterium]|nr:hypothetical protein [Elusimicrobiota bacterium]
MSQEQSVKVPLSVIEKLEAVLWELERQASCYRPEFLARMYRARASDLEGKGKSLSEIHKRFR